MSSFKVLLRQTWTHIKGNGLQSIRNATLIQPDAKLAAIVGPGELSMRQLSKELHRHLLKSRAPRETEEAKRLGAPYFPHL